jgi:hypothetical protein
MKKMQSQKDIYLAFRHISIFSCLFPFQQDLIIIFLLLPLLWRRLKERKEKKRNKIVENGNKWKRNQKKEKRKLH